MDNIKKIKRSKTQIEDTNLELSYNKLWIKAGEDFKRIKKELETERAYQFYLNDLKKNNKYCEKD